MLLRPFRAHTDSGRLLRKDRPKDQIIRPISNSITGPINGSHIAIGENIDQSHTEIHHLHSPTTIRPEWQKIGPDPIQIRAEVRKAKAVPYDEIHTKAKFRETPVGWMVKLTEIELHATSYWITAVFMASETQLAAAGIPFIATGFYLDTVPSELRSAPRNSLFQVTGTVEFVGDYLI